MSADGFGPRLAGKVAAISGIASGQAKAAGVLADMDRSRWRAEEYAPPNIPVDGSWTCV